MLIQVTVFLLLHADLSGRIILQIFGNKVAESILLVNWDRQDFCAFRG